MRWRRIVWAACWWEACAIPVTMLAGFGLGIVLRLIRRRLWREETIDCACDREGGW